MDFVMTGETQTRVFDFMRIRTAIGLELKGMRMSQGSALQAARFKYLPDCIRTREAAYEYMSYVVTLLTVGEGAAKLYGEEIVTGKLVYASQDECGCPAFSGTEQSAFITEAEIASMCIHQEG